MMTLLAMAWLLLRWGRNILAASCIVAEIFLSVTGPLITNPLDPSLLPLFEGLTIGVILAGALMPPRAALIVGAISCVEILLIATMHPNKTPAYDLMLKQDLYTVTVMLPIAIQIIVAVVIYMVMNNWSKTIRRADRAEEIVALQTELAEHERKRWVEQQQLEEGFYQIAQTHARIANGDFQARVSLREGHVMWSVAIPLNNLLNRLQRWQGDVELLAATRMAARQVAALLQQTPSLQNLAPLQPTGTPLDSVILEINRMTVAQTGRPVRPDFSNWREN
jgi:hypothetical protein